MRASRFPRSSTRENLTSTLPCEIFVLAIFRDRLQKNLHIFFSFDFSDASNFARCIDGTRLEPGECFEGFIRKDHKMRHPSFIPSENSSGVPQRFKKILIERGVPKLFSNLAPSTGFRLRRPCHLERGSILHYGDTQFRESDERILTSRREDQTGLFHFTKKLVQIIGR